MLRNRYVQILLISIILTAAYYSWIAPLKAASIADLKLLDSYFNLASKMNPSPKNADNMVLVTIDDESLRRINMQWPWPRSVIAGIIDKLSKDNPRLICADLVFAGKSFNPQEDMALIGAIKNSANVLGAAYFGNDGRYVVPDEPIALALADFGFVNKPRDTDNGVRRMRPYFLSPRGEVIDYSLSLKTAAKAIGAPSVNIAQALPVSRDGTAYIKFSGRQDRFTVIPVWKIMEGAIGLPSLKDKLVFFGVTSEAFHDTYSTPLGMMPGVVIDLNETLTYINKDFFRYAIGNVNFAILFFFALIAVAGGLSLPVLAGIVFAGILVAGSFFFGLFLFMRHIITAPFGPVFLIIASTVLLHGMRSILLALENIVLKKEAITDGLTGLYVYRYFELQLKRELIEASHSRKNLALVIYDIDHFKKINDTYGHEFGNTVLGSISKSLKNHSRKNSLIARYGGEEFCIIITGMDKAHAVKYAERLRNLVGLTEFRTDKGEIVKITMSGGVVTTDDILPDNTTDFIKAADSALYRSKNEGRNRITVFDKEQSPL